MTKLLRAQATFAHASGLPRDNVSMNFWFASVAAAEADATEVAAKVQSFFMDPVAPRSSPLATHFSGVITNGGHTVKVYEYDMATGERLSYEGAPPLATVGFALGGIARDAGEAMPGEVACCLSFRNNTGTVPGGGTFATPAARRRGRIYFGPCTVDSSAPADAGTPRPTATLIDKLTAAAFAMMDTTPEDNEWVIYSRPFAGRAEIVRPGRPTLPALPARPGQAYYVQQAWVDNAWDTQRRRGEKATARTYV